jgi:isocitrate lyase
MRPEDDIPERVTALENEVGRMRDELTVARTDAEAARVLASGSDHDVSEVRAELRAHMRAIGALREEQVAVGREMRRGFAMMDRRFAEFDQRFERHKHRFARIDERFDQYDRNFAKIDQNFAQVDQNFMQVERQFATVHAGLRQIVGLIEGITPE